MEPWYHICSKVMNVSFQSAVMFGAPPSTTGSSRQALEYMAAFDGNAFDPSTNCSRIED